MYKETQHFNPLVDVFYSLKGVFSTEFFPLGGAGSLSFQMTNVKAVKSESGVSVLVNE